jgi:hypothetical protein
LLRHEQIDRKTSPAVLPDLRQAGRAGFQAILLGALRDIDLNRWLSGVYAVPAKDEEDEDGERPAEGEAGDR